MEERDGQVSGSGHLWPLLGKEKQLNCPLVGNLVSLPLGPLLPLQLSCVLGVMRIHLGLSLQRGGRVLWVGLRSRQGFEKACPLGVPCSLVNKRAPVECAQAELPHRYFATQLCWTSRGRGLNGDRGLVEY